MWSIYFIISILIGVTLGYPYPLLEPLLSEKDLIKIDPNEIPESASTSKPGRRHITAYRNDHHKPKPSKKPKQFEHHHPSKSNAPTPKPIIDMSLVKEHYATANKDSVYRPLEYNPTSSEDTATIVENLINTYGFDQAVHILEGRVSINLPSHPSDQDIDVIRNSLLKAIYDYKSLRPVSPTPDPHVQQEINKLNIKMTPSTTTGKYDDAVVSEEKESPSLKKNETLKHKRNTADDLEEYLDILTEVDDAKNSDTVRNSKRAVKPSDGFPADHFNQSQTGSTVRPPPEQQSTTVLVPKRPRWHKSGIRKHGQPHTHFMEGQIVTNFTATQTHLHSDNHSTGTGKQVEVVKNETRKEVSRATSTCPTFNDFVGYARLLWTELAESTGFVNSLKVVSEAVARSMKALGSCFLGMASDLWSYFFGLFQSHPDSPKVEIIQINSTSMG